MVGNSIYHPSTGKVFSFGPDEDPQNVDPFWYTKHTLLYVGAVAQGNEREFSWRPAAYTYLMARCVLINYKNL